MKWFGQLFQVYMLCLQKLPKKKLHAYMMRHLREIMNISWKDKISNKVILEKTGPPPMADILIQINLRWLGYVDRMDFTRIPRQLFYSQLRDGKRFKDIVKKKI